MSLEANKFLGRLSDESVEDQRRIHYDVLKKIKEREKEEKEEEVKATKYLDEYSFQRFKRSVGVVILNMNEASEYLAEGSAVGATASDERLALEGASDIITVWNNVVISLGILGYKKLFPTDKKKVDDVLNSLLPQLNVILEKVKSAKNSYVHVPSQNTFDVVISALDDVITQIQSKNFKSVPYPIYNF